MHETNIAVAKLNARLVTVSSFFSDLTFILPVWLLYSLDILHFKPTLAIAIFMSIWVVSALLEVPTGAAADRFGRRKIFIVGQLLFSLYPLAYAFKLPVGLLILVCFISAIGSSMRSGALLPIVHSIYEQAGLGDKAYNLFLSNNQMAMFIARAITGVTGAWLYTLNPTWPFYAMFGATIFNFGLGFFIKDTPVPKEKTSNYRHIKQTFALVRKSSVVVGILAAYATFNMTAETIWTGYQVFFQDDGRSAFVIGVLFSAAAIFSTLGAYLIRYGSARFHPLKLMELFGLGVLGTAVLLMQPNHLLRLAAIVPVGLGFGTTSVILNSTIQKHIINRYQATALSMVNFLQYGVYAIGSLAFGILLQTFGAANTRVALFGTSLAASVGVMVYGLAHKPILHDSVATSPKKYQTENEAVIE
jgi:MFS family permease